jgi:hypothetical protein
MAAPLSDGRTLDMGFRPVMAASQTQRGAGCHKLQSPSPPYQVLVASWLLAAKLGVSQKCKLCLILLANMEGSGPLAIACPGGMNDQQVRAVLAVLALIIA